MIGGYFVPAGTHVGISILGLHRNPKIWKNPLQFNPERWCVTAKHAEEKRPDEHLPTIINVVVHENGS